jgi:ribosomal-protein-alanine N-acetyltransferase
VSPNWRIRPMTPEDVSAVMALADSLPAAPHWRRETYNFALDPASRPQRVALVAEDPDGALAGFAIASITGPEAELESIAVMPELQRQGVARSLFNRLAALLRERGLQAVFLEVRASNRGARSLYESLSFSQSGCRKAYYSNPPEDAVILRLDLAPMEPNGPSRP